jgi:RNA polymerase sigma-70 factor (ECF subfamily)
VSGDLVRRAAAGDDIAFAAVVRIIRPRMYRWALVQLMDEDDAEDVTQRALVRMRSALPRFRGNASFSTWAYTIVRSATADWRRSERRREAMHGRHAARMDANTIEQPAPTDFDDLLNVVRRRMLDLPARQREVFDLVDLQGLSSQQAAAMLSLNHNTTRVHLMRARRTLRTQLIEQHATLVEDRI